MPDNLTAPASSAPSFGNSWGRERTFGERSFEAPQRPFKAPEPPAQLKPVAGSRRIVSNDTPADIRDSVTSAAGTLRQGSRIRHERFGLGTIEAIEGVGDNCKISVAFDNVGRKQLLLKFAKFTII
jgi:DNA helicase-2/ATP-dependent DNA helicase PcrA